MVGNTAQNKNVDRVKNHSLKKKLKKKQLSFFLSTAARQWSGQADSTLFSHYETQALMFPTQSVCLELRRKYIVSVISLRRSREVETRKSTEAELAPGTHRGCELQLRSLSVALLEELAGHQLCHLKRQKRFM